MKRFVVAVGLVFVAAALILLFCFHSLSLLEAGRLADSSWVGTYHSGAALFSHQLSINANGQFHDRQDGCLQHDEVTGIVDDSGGRLRLSPRWSNGNPLRDRVNPALEYLMIRWGPRRYLVPPEKILNFCAAVRAGGEPRDRVWGIYLLMEGDEKSDPDAPEPQLPQGFEKYLRMKELDVGVKAVSTESTVSVQSSDSADVLKAGYLVTLDAGSFEGVLPRMTFEKPPPRNGPEVVILETSKHESKGVVSFSRPDSGPLTPPKIGDRFVAPSPEANSSAFGRAYPLAGKVTIDGRPPEGEGQLIVMLYERKSFRRMSERPFVVCRPNGEFSFSTYRAGDGARAGTFVVLFARLTHGKKPRWELLGPDRLGNRYNDPDKNAERPGFVIEHKTPGRTDYVFDLKTRGVDPIKEPGPRALTEIRD